ncbi:hypothetical protein TorRG33x02_131360, partial [Trema orientale]
LVSNDINQNTHEPEKYIKKEKTHVDLPNHTRTRLQKIKASNQIQSCHFSLTTRDDSDEDTEDEEDSEEEEEEEDYLESSDNKDVLLPRGDSITECSSEENEVEAAENRYKVVRPPLQKSHRVLYEPILAIVNRFPFLHMPF